MSLTVEKLKIDSIEEINQLPELHHCIKQIQNSGFGLRFRDFHSMRTNVFPHEIRLCRLGYARQICQLSENFCL